MTLASYKVCIVLVTIVFSILMMPQSSWSADAAPQQGVEIDTLLPSAVDISPRPALSIGEVQRETNALFIALGLVVLLLLLTITVLWRLWSKSDTNPPHEPRENGVDTTGATSTPSTAVQLKVGHATSAGRERSVNEDSLLTLDLSPILPENGPPLGLFVVADGMGGHAAGDMASRLAVDGIARAAKRSIDSPSILSASQEWLTGVAQAASHAVYHHRQAAESDMGTTLVMALFIGQHVTVGNVGDSRAYKLSHEVIEQITTDHSLVERLIATGQITTNEARHHPQKNVIYRIVGDKKDLKLDVWECQLDHGEALLLCSDGLSSMVRDKYIWEIWKTSSLPQEACDRLIDAANRAGGEDNITVILVQLSI